MTADMLGVLRPSVYRFKLGGFEVTTIMDGFIQRDGPFPIFGNDQPVETVQDYARANGLDPENFEHSFTTTLVNTGKELVLFDAGFGAMMRGKGAGNLRERLTAAGYSPNDIDIVAITHGHPDHIAGLMEDGAPAYPNARYVIGQKEYDWWVANENIPEQRKDNQGLFVKIVEPLAPQSTFLQPGDDVVTGVRAVEAFGHSMGHMAYMIESDGMSLIIWGDITNHYVMSLQKPEWRVAFDDDPEQAIATRKRVLDMVATDNLWTVGFHMPFPSIGKVEKTSESYRWVPASYQLNL